MPNHVVLWASGSPSAWVQLVVVLIIVYFAIFPAWRRYLKRHGYSGIMGYLLKAPQTDKEKLHAIGLTLNGAALCVVGWGVFPFLYGLFDPFFDRHVGHSIILLFGLFLLYFGVRKLMMIRLGIRPPNDKP